MGRCYLVRRRRSPPSFDYGRYAAALWLAASSAQRRSIPRSPKFSKFISFLNGFDPAPTTSKMVLISEIANKEKGKQNEEETPEPGDANGGGESEEAEESEEHRTPTPVTQIHHPIPTPAPAPTPAADPTTGKGVYNDYAFQVAYIMRRYIHMSHIHAATAPSPAAYGGRSPMGGCGASMEVAREASGRWAVAIFVVEHTHSLSPPPDAAGTLAGVIPVIGMEFESIAMAKAFYQTYSEKMGFKCKTGAGRRAKDNQITAMQRFYCSKGSYTLSKQQTPDAKEQRPVYTPYRKIAPKPSKDGEVVVVPDGSPKEEALTEKSGNGSAGESTQVIEKDGELVEEDAEKKMEQTEGGYCRPKDGKVPLVSNPGQSRLLRELGIRVSRYTHEERRDVLSKYMKKRNGRQVVDRSIKVSSRQAHAERRQRGIGGKFLRKEEMEVQTSKGQEETIEEEVDIPTEDVASAGGKPIVGMVFENADKAFEYYIKYAGNVGFSVRKAWEKSSKNITRLRVYVCSREGSRSKTVLNDGRLETRTGCAARMAIKLISNNKYRVTEFVPDHNHALASPLGIQMLSPLETPAKARSGWCQAARLIPADYKNYVRSKRMKDMRNGDAQAVLGYLVKMKGDNPSFYYAIQVDEDDQIANVFWADAKSMMDFHYFGDVVCFDTSYKIIGYDRPLALFLGVNHHKQAIIFGTALLYDESLESFKWLFETFKMAMSGNQPKTILVEQCSTVIDAVTAVWPGTTQRLCIWHLYQNALKQIDHIHQSSETFAHNFSLCLYDCDEEEEFISAWNSMLSRYNLKDNLQFTKLFEERHKWAPVYSYETFCGDMEYTLQSESLNNVLKEHLRLERDLSCFLKEYEKLLDERRCAEIEADYCANRSPQVTLPLQLLWQTANAYTPASFDMFRREFELFMNCAIFSSGEIGPISQYVVTVKDRSRAHTVTFDTSNGQITCSCKKFERVGIQCCHVLKALDFRNIKELPPQYILKRWRKDAKLENGQVSHEFALDDGHRSSVLQRYHSLCHVLYKIAAKASENAETFALMVSQSDQLVKQVERILQTMLLEKNLQPNISKAQTSKAPESDHMQHDSDNETQKASGGKRKDGIVQERPHGELETNKRQKDQNGRSAELEAAATNILQTAIFSQPRLPPCQSLAHYHFLQAPYVPGHHQFGLSGAQGFNAMTQFNQDSSATVLQQQAFHGGAHLSQNDVQPFPMPDVHSLQFVAGNAQLDHQRAEQGQCAMPVWDFL